jgi:hypothetical protein
MQKVERSRMPEPRITISFKPPPCLQGFELPLKDHIVSGIGITTNKTQRNMMKTDIEIQWMANSTTNIRL